jgi:hypothetical protein
MSESIDISNPGKPKRVVIIASNPAVSTLCARWVDHQTMTRRRSG